MKKLFIAEKPSVSKQLKEMLSPKAKYTNVAKFVGYYEDDRYIFTSAAGHLFELQEPDKLNPKYEKWDMEDLPMDLPREWPLQINKNSKKTFDLIKQLSQRKDIDEIIVCTDPDREGQLIWGYIEEMLPPLKVKVSRAWFTEWSPEKMTEAINNRQPNSNYKDLEKAGRCRAIDDAVEGYNDSRVVSCKFGSYGNIFSIGRVQTFTQNLVYQREKEIENFKPETYSTLDLIASSDSKETLTLNHKTNRHWSGKELEELKNRMEQDPTITLHTETTRKTRNVKKLYSTNDILKEMGSKYKISSKRTTQILQDLYQKYALTTYPRTDAREISKSNAENHAINALKNLKETGLFNKEIKKVLNNHWTISNSVVSNTESLAHEAITPVFGSIDPMNVYKLDSDERKVYEAIVRRYLQAFYPKAVFDETVITGEKENETFEAKGKIFIDKGFMEITGIENDTALPPITDGNTYNILDYDIEEKITTPPARYTESTLLEAMENAGRFVDDKQEKTVLKNVKGVGTGATRAGIIDTLYKRDYIEKKGKTIYPTKKTMDLMSELPPTPLTSASSTAHMEILLDDIQAGRLTPDAFFDEVDSRTAAFVEAVKGIEGHTIKNDQKTIGKCPICGKPVVETAKGWQCSGWKDSGCNFMIWKRISGKTISEKTAKELIEKNKTSTINNFVSKKGTNFNAALTWAQDENGNYDYTHMIFDFSLPAVCKCPRCGGNIVETKQSFTCENWKNGCQTYIWKSALKRRHSGNITAKEAIQLFAGKSVRHKCKSKAGKDYYIDVTYNLQENKIEMDFPNNQSTKKPICQCPKCGGDIIETEKSFSCANWREGCKATIWKNALSYRGAKNITKTDAKKLFAGKIIKMQFVSKKGSTYYGNVFYNKDTNKLEIGSISFD